MAKWKNIQDYKKENEKVKDIKEKVNDTFLMT